MSRKMQVMFFVPRVFASRNVTQLSTIRCKLTKAEILKRLQKENKTLFGALVETKKEKTAREKRAARQLSEAVVKQSTVSLSKNEKSLTDTETHHVSNSENLSLSKLKFMGRKPPYQTKKILVISGAKNSSKGIKNSKKTKTPTLKNSETIPIFENLNPIPDPGIPQSEIKSITSNGSETRNINLPTSLLINKMTLFPYLDINKKTRIEILEDKKPISIPPYSDRSKLSIPSVTRILNKTMSAQSKLNLELWKQRMILQLGLEGFEKYSQELLLNGKQFHSSIQNHLMQKPFDVPSTVEKSWQSVEHVLKEVDTAQVIESHVVHSKLYYRGIVDCVASYRGNLCVIDWKKSDKPKNSIENTFDAPVQVASYIGALNSDSNYNFQVRNGLVVVGYTNGDPATVHHINPTLLNKYWILWLRRLQQYYLDLNSAE